MTTTTAVEIATYETADDYACGVRILWDETDRIFVIGCIETDYEIVRTVSPVAAVVYAAAALMEYGDVADGDWSATVAQGREMLADLDRHVAWLVASISAAWAKRDTEVSRSDV